MKKRHAVILPILMLLALSGCNRSEGVELKRYQASFLTLFDTVTTIVGYSSDEESFRSEIEKIHDELEVYHQLYDIYTDYEGVNNIKTINDNAGIAPVVVDRRIIDLLLFSKDMYEATDGAVNIAMGSVLSIWHDYRSRGLEDPSSAALPDMRLLEEASKHTDIDKIIIDEDASTVYLADPEMSLDVGALAKGFAVECVSKSAPSYLLISVGGNVSSTGEKPDGTPWVVGLQDPEGKTGSNVHTVYLEKGAVVTSGSYQRYYVVDGVEYNHIIDPETLMPGTRWLSVSVLADDSGVADGLSTALFLLPQKEGQSLLDAFGAEAVWTDNERIEYFSPGFKERMRT